MPNSEQLVASPLENVVQHILEVMRMLDISSGIAMKCAQACTVISNLPPEEAKTALDQLCSKLIDLSIRLKVPIESLEMPATSNDDIGLADDQVPPSDG